MMVTMIDYLIYITHHFLTLLKGINEHDIKGRSINAVTIALFFLCFTAFSILYILIISAGLLNFNKLVYFIICVSSFLILFRMIKKIYNNRYETVIIDLDAKFNYKNHVIVVIFLLIWFISILSFWGGILLFRKFL